MSRYMNLRVKTEKAVLITSRLKDFDGDEAKWKEAFHTLCYSQALLGFAYRIEMKENLKDGLFVALIVKKLDADHIVRIMKNRGYRNISTSSACVGLVDTEDATKHEWEHLNTYFDCFAKLE